MPMPGIPIMPGCGCAAGMPMPGIPIMPACGCCCIIPGCIIPGCIMPIPPCAFVRELE